MKGHKKNFPGGKKRGGEGVKGGDNDLSHRDGQSMAKGKTWQKVGRGRAAAWCSSTIDRVWQGPAGVGFDWRGQQLGRRWRSMCLSVSSMKLMERRTLLESEKRATWALVRLTFRLGTGRPKPSQAVKVLGPETSDEQCLDR